MDPGNLPVGSKQGQLAAVRGRGFETHPSPRVRSLILMLACTQHTQGELMTFAFLIPNDDNGAITVKARDANLCLDI